MRIGGDVDEDMIRGLILAECVEEEGLPPVVVWWKIVEEDKDHRLDVEDGDGLSMKSGDRDMCLSGAICLEDIVVMRRRWRNDSRLSGWRGGG
jgi:hypothetical protein